MLAVSDALGGYRASPSITAVSSQDWKLLALWGGGEASTMVSREPGWEEPLLREPGEVRGDWHLFGEGVACCRSLAVDW